MRNLPTWRKLLVLGTVVALFACQKEQLEKETNDEVQSVSAKADQSTKYNTFKGDEVPMGVGYARSWVTLSHTGVPLAIGIEMTEAAITSLVEHSLATMLPLHHKAIDATAFEHIVVNWNLHGHPPAEVFTVAHFDLHFYTITNEERLAIPPYPLAVAAFNNHPPVGFIPASYVPDPGGVPQMGKHWFDGSVAAGTFTKALVYGSYNGEVNFIEPMITRSVMLSGVPFSLPIPQPDLFAEHTYYPTMYNFFVDNGKYYITLSDFVLR